MDKAHRQEIEGLLDRLAMELDDFLMARDQLEVIADQLTSAQPGLIRLCQTTVDRLTYFYAQMDAGI
jgi:hypothetical protein